MSAFHTLLTNQSELKRSNSPLKDTFSYENWKRLGDIFKTLNHVRNYSRTIRLFKSICLKN